MKKSKAKTVPGMPWMTGKRATPSMGKNTTAQHLAGPKKTKKGS